MTNNSIEDLQTKVAFLEDALEKLSDEYFKQQQELEILKRQYQIIVERLQQISESETNTYINEKPPHY